VTKLSAILHGFFLIAAVLTIPQWLNLIPLASLAAILLVVGYKLARPTTFKKIYAQGPRQFVPFAVTVAAIVFTDLLVGIGIGLATAIISILLDHYRRPFTGYSIDPDGRTCVVTLPEDVTFLHKAGIREALASIPDGGHIRLDTSKTKRIDPDVLEIIDEFKEHAVADGITVEYIEPANSGNGIAPLQAFKKSLLLAKEKAQRSA
jgi:MFS superfamily sulfate permease-like transporter